MIQQDMFETLKAVEPDEILPPENGGRAHSTGPTNDPIDAIRKLGQDALDHGELVAYKKDTGEYIYSSFDSITLKDGDHEVTISVSRKKAV